MVNLIQNDNVNFLFEIVFFFVTKCLKLKKIYCIVIDSGMGLVNLFFCIITPVQQNGVIEIPVS